jgi:hypothetical protein
LFSLLYILYIESRRRLEIFIFRYNVMLPLKFETIGPPFFDIPMSFVCDDVIMNIIFECFILCLLFCNPDVLKLFIGFRYVF